MSPPGQDDGPPGEVTGPTGARTWLACDHAWLGDRMGHDVLVGIGADGTLTDVVEGTRDGTGPTTAGPGQSGEVPEHAVQHVAGVVLPGLVNAHSHAFHRLLRGRAQPGPPDPAGRDSAGGRPSAVDDAETFWSWRDRMYAVAGRLDPDGLFATARAVYGEMALAGITCVGEFHYLHHQPGGRPYGDPNAMGRALVAAATDVGIRLTLLDTLYLTGRIGADLDHPDLDPVQQRFSDGDEHRWAGRVAALDETPTVRLGAAIHSVRAVPAASMAAVADFATGTAAGPARVLHAHVAEQTGEVETCRSATGQSPTRVLAEAGALSDRFTAVHGVWLDEESVGLLAEANATVCACPTTERDLADGVVDGSGLAAAGVRLALGSDQHAVVDLFEEARALELDQRLVTGTRGHHAPADLLVAATAGGAASLGWPEAGRIAIGAVADLVVVGTDSVRLAGTLPDDLATAVVYAATAADVRATMVAGRWIVRDGRHLTRDVIDDLDTAMATTAGQAGTPGGTP